ncbi:hypothetical protein [Synechococcus sp. WH 8016]|uniref:hypothetical protein n=1 Tax=Synechococcus sp. WH 8016 TaxID=166318 RepID=UPI001145FE82|nr:hypothetical protein [Synechococcus sp. WH 8016]
MTTTSKRTNHKQVLVRHCPNARETFSAARFLMAQQTVYPVKPGSKTEAWFKPFLNHFMTIEGMVFNTQPFEKVNLKSNIKRSVNLISLATVCLVAAEDEVTSVFKDAPYPQLGEDLKIVTTNSYMEGDLVRLNVLPLENEWGLQVAHDSVTLKSDYLQRLLKARLVALLESIEWTYENLFQLIQDFDLVSREVFNNQPFWLSDRKKMLTYSTPLERLDGLKQVVDYSAHLMKLLLKDGVMTCAAELLKTQRGDHKVQPLHELDPQYLSLLQTDMRLRIRTLEAGPFLLKDNPRLWEHTGLE